MEYYGPGLEGLSAMDRHVIANMGAELGATTTVFPSDAHVLRFLEGQGRGADWEEWAADPGCSYEHHEEIDLSEIEPLIALPSSPGNVRRVREVAGDRRPDLLVSLTNDSWFSGWEPAQHLNFTRFRAVEHRAPLVRATNTGISAFIGATGDVESSLAWDQEGVLVADVPFVARERTIYARFGWRFPWLLGAWALLAWLVAMMRPPASVSP